MQRPTHRSGVRVAIFTVLLAVAAVAALTPGLAGAETPPSTAPTATVYIKLVKGNLQFVAPKTVTAGTELTIVNKTNPKQVGPHTFSLVAPGSRPKTAKARQTCFTPKHICKAIAEWQGVKGEGAPTINPATAGLAGWDTEGTLTSKGDSWFTGKKPNASFTQQVSAAPGTTLDFMCAIHPWMQGSIKVLPAS